MFGFAPHPEPARRTIHVRNLFWRRELPLTAGVVLLASSVYMLAIRNGFALDDVSMIEHNPVVHGFGRPRELLLGPWWPFSAELYRPLTLTSFALDWQLWGPNPAAMHAVNVVLHAACSALVLRLLLRIGAAPAAATAGAALFAVHPVHVEAVANVVGRAELLATLFVLLAATIHVKPACALSRTAAIASCYMLGLLAKENAVTLPALLLALDTCRPANELRPRLRETLRRRAPLLGVLLGILSLYLLLRRYTIGETFGTLSAPYFYRLPTFDRIATAVRLWPEMARLSFWPQDLSYEWGPGAIPLGHWTDPLVWLGAALGVAVAAIAALDWGRQRRFTLAILWFSIAALPVSNLLFPVGVMLAERTLYLPSVGIALLVPAVQGLGRATGRSLGPALLGAALVLGSVRTWTRVPVWRSTDHLTDSLALEHPESWRIQHALGAAYANSGNLVPAFAHYRQAVSLTRGYEYPLNIDFATVLLWNGCPKEAEHLLRRAVERVPRGGSGYVFLSAALIDQNRFLDALEAVSLGRRFGVGVPRLRTTLAHHAALAYDGLGKPELAFVENAASLNERSVPAERTLLRARLLHLSGRESQARTVLDSVLLTQPGWRSIVTSESLAAPNSRLVRGWVRVDTLAGCPDFRPQSGGE